MDVAQADALELNEGLPEFKVVGRDEEPIGEVMRVSRDGACLLVATRKALFGRSKEHAIHRRAITDVDSDTQTITVAGTREQVEQAPPYSNLDPSDSEKLANYYA